MSQVQISQPDVRNRLLAALPPGDFALLAPSLRPVELSAAALLTRPAAASRWPRARQLLGDLRRDPARVVAAQPRERHRRPAPCPELRLPVPVQEASIMRCQQE